MIVLHHLRIGRSIFTVWQLEELGVEITERIALETPHNPHNQKYLATKAGKLGHLMG